MFFNTLVFFRFYFYRLQSLSYFKPPMAKQGAAFSELFFLWLLGLAFFILALDFYSR